MYPYLAKTTIKYKSPHATDLSFGKEETIRVVGPSDDDEDWLVGETLDGSKSGGFPKDFVTRLEPSETEEVAASAPEPQLEADRKASEPSHVATVSAVKPDAPAPATDNDEPKSLKDRLAFFNAPAKAAPPPIRPKPAAGGLTWSQRQKIREEQEAKEKAGASVAQDSTDAPKEGTGMSTSDAQSSITKGGSLKERMAALQGAGAFGAPAEDKQTPKPSGKVWSRPAEEPQEEAQEEEGHDIQEDDEEKTRRAAIAERMAKLGARGPMGLPPPKPARKPTMEAREKGESTEDVVAKAPESVVVQEDGAPESAENEDKASEPVKEDKASEPVEEDKAPASIAMPSIPRRTAGPRRPGRPARAKTDELEKRVEKVHEDGSISPPPAVMVQDEERAVEKPQEQMEEEARHEEAGRGEDGGDGAESAGIALSSIEEPTLTTNERDSDQPSPLQEEAPVPPPRSLPLPPAAPDSGDASRPDNDLADAGRPMPPAPLGIDDAPPPPPWPLSKRPVVGEISDDNAPPPPPRSLPRRPVNSESDDEDAPAAPPRPLPLRSEAPGSTDAPPPPTRRVIDDVSVLPAHPSIPDVDEDAPPPPPRLPAPLKTSGFEHVDPSAPAAAVDTSTTSPVFSKGSLSPKPASASVEADDAEETPEEEAERRRKILARMRAGGTLGFGMFHHGPPQPEESPVEAAGEEALDETSPGHNEAPSSPGRVGDTGVSLDTPRPPIPASRPSIDVAPSPTAASPPVSVSRPSIDLGTRPPVPTSRPSIDSPASARPIIATSRPSIDSPASARPPIPTSRPSLDVKPTSPSYASTDHPSGPAETHAEIDEEDDVPPPPPRPRVDTRVAEPEELPATPMSAIRRSMSVASAGSKESPIRRSMTASRPAYNDLAAASKQVGGRVIKAAQMLAAQAKKGAVGDGSAQGFVAAVMAQAQAGEDWGTVVFEQEAGSVLKKLDEPRPGDIVALYDARFKGKKGLSGYTQHVGSVEEPLVGVISEVEQKKHKLRVIQVERGVSDEVSYRCDDLKSGRVIVHRAGV